MLRLNFVRRPTADHRREGTLVQVWRDLEDTERAYGYVGPGWWAMEWSKLGTFRFGPTLGDSVEVTADPEVPVGRIQAVFDRSVVPLLFQALGHETLHASAVRASNGVLAFCGERGAGKSTIAYGLCRRGFQQYADDTLVLKVGPNQITTTPLPFAPRLRPASAEFFTKAWHADARFNFETMSPEPLAAVFILRQATLPYAPVVEPLTPHQAFRAVLAHAHSFDPESPDSRRRLVQNYLEISGCVPMFAVAYTPGLDRLEALLDAVMAAAGQPSAVLAST